MKNTIVFGLATILSIAVMQSDAYARGFGGGGGGFHGGGSFGGAGGFHGSDFGGGHPGGFDAGGYHPGGDNLGGYHPGGDNLGGYHPGEAGGGAYHAGGWGAAPNRGELNNFLGLPTDAGMHAAGPKTVTNMTAAGAHANIAAHNEVPNRDVGPAARGAAAAYGTHNFSSTYCRSQGMAAQRWWHDSGVFTPRWSANHPWAWRPGAYNAAAWATAAWRYTTWPALGTWFGWDAAPGYYDYGDNITYQDDNVYYGAQPVATTQQYYTQAASIASAGGSAASDANAQWMPLGVFGLMDQGQTTPTMVFQLAVDKAGDIAGNYYDQAADKNVPVTGSVDKKNQRAAWQVSGNKNLVVETGLYNLTQDQSTALVHNGPDETKQYVLVRMKQPEGQDSQD